MQPQLKIDNITKNPSIDTIVHLGAGRCSELDGYLAQQPRRLLLVEADPQLAEDLQNRTKDRESVQVSCAAISGQPGPATFNRYNLPEVNSLHAANKLIELFPGLKTVEKLEVNAISPDSLLRLLELNVKQENLLIIDLPGEELPVLQVLKQSQKLHLFSQMILHCGCEPLYEGSEPAKQVLEWLQDEGFDLVAEDNSINPDRPCWTLRRNNMQLRNHELQDQVEQLANKNLELKNDAAALQDRVETLSKKLDFQNKLSKEQKTQIRQLKKARDEQAKIVAEQQTKIEELTKITVEAKKNATEQQLNRFEKIEQSLRNQFKKELENSTKQIKSLIGIQTYHAYGYLIPEMHGWPVSPDFAFYLISLIGKNNYDLIIEFGSGASTVLMAKALYKHKQMKAIRQLNSKDCAEKMHYRITARKKIDDLHIVPEILKQALPDIRDISPCIVTFEHHQQYFEKTLKMIREAGINNLVELNYAPLCDYLTCEGEHFLYYACEKRVANLSSQLKGNKAKILVVVDGPPGKTGKHARYPALPIILQYLASHSIDMVLDDFNRKDEKEVVSRWTCLLEQRSLSYKKDENAFEKGSCLLSIN